MRTALLKWSIAFLDTLTRTASASFQYREVTDERMIQHLAVDTPNKALRSAHYAPAVARNLEHNGKYRPLPHSRPRCDLLAYDADRAAAAAAAAIARIVEPLPWRGILEALEGYDRFRVLRF
jgi:hypothetical protein